VKESGRKHTEVWERKIIEEGAYNYVGHENAPAYMKALGKQLAKMTTSINLFNPESF
jgi:hypothetical protein